MKKTYSKPKARTIHLHIQTNLLGGSNIVNTYTHGSDITVGDTDEPSGARSSGSWFGWFD